MYLDISIHDNKKRGNKNHILLDKHITTSKTMLSKTVRSQSDNHFNLTINVAEIIKKRNMLNKIIGI